jgi:putative ABC transport system permease protein
VRSFRSTVDTWITQSIRGDLYVEPFGHRELGGATALPPAFVDAVRALPGVRAVDTFRGARIVVGSGAAARPAVAIGVDLGVQRHHGALAFVHGDAAAILDRALARDEAIVTESFAYHARLAAGDTLALATPTGTARLRIAGVVYDYSTDAGVVYLDRALFARWWRDPRTESLALYLAPGADAAAVRARVVALAGPDLVLSVTPNRALRERALQVFDQTFQVTWALQGIAVLVAVLGVIGTLTGLVLQRGRELAVLRAIGATRRQVVGMVVTESVWIGTIGAALGSACGTVLALILVHVINRQFFGWTIRFTLEPWLFVQAFAIVVVTAALAGLVPARLAVQRVAPEAMRVDG